MTDVCSSPLTCEMERPEVEECFYEEMTSHILWLMVLLDRKCANKRFSKCQELSQHFKFVGDPINDLMDGPV